MRGTRRAPSAVARQSGTDAVFYDFVVSGSGIVGSAVVRALQLLSEHDAARRPRGRALRTLQVDRAKPPLFDSANAQQKLRTVAITPMSSRILNNLGVWSLLKHKHPFHRMAIRHEKQTDSLFNAVFPTGLFASSAKTASGLPPLLEFLDLDAPMGYICYNDELQAALQCVIAAGNATPQPAAPGGGDIATQSDATPESATPRVDVRFDSELLGLRLPPRGDLDLLSASVSTGDKGASGEQRVQASLLLGCEGRAADGVGAVVASPTIERDYSQCGFVASVELEPLSDGNVCTFQHFFADGRIVGFLPTGESTANLVFSTTRADAARLMQKKQEELSAELNALLADLAPRDVPRIVRVTVDASPEKLVRGFFPLKLRVATKPFGPRAVLLGDAAHAIHPLAGQGLNLGLYDVATLADEVDAALSSGEDVGAESVLHRVSMRMMAQTGPIIAAGELIKYSTSNLPLLSCTGMHALNVVPWVKEKGIQHLASGQHLYNPASLLFR